MSRHQVRGGDLPGLLERLSDLQRSVQRRTSQIVPVVVIQEAGLDGFWIHRALVTEGIESHVVDPASIAVSRRHRRAKTDRIDGEALVRTLMAWKRGEQHFGCGRNLVASTGESGARTECVALARRIAQAQAAQARGRRAGQQDRQDRLENDGDRRGL